MEGSREAREGVEEELGVRVREDSDFTFEIGGGRREMITLSRMTELLAERNTRSPDAYTRISLGGKSFSLEAANLVATVLEGLVNVEVADLADIIAGRPEDEALQVLRIICGSLRDRQLRIVDLSDNALGQKGIDACRGVLEAKNGLSSLFVCNNGLSAEAAAVLRDLLLFRTPTELRVFHFHNNMSGNVGAANLGPIIEHSPHLTDLRFSATRAGKEGTLVFTRSLLNLTSLVKLDLADNSFDDQGSQLLATVLSQQPNLSEIVLRDCALEYEGGSRIIDVLTTLACPLVKFDLSGNELSPLCAVPLADLIRSKPQLQYIGLDENELSSDGVKHISPQLKKLSSLSVLLLQNNDITSGSAVAVVKAIAHAPITKLELDGNAISTRGLDIIKAALEACGKLDALGRMEENDEEGDDDIDDDDGDAEADDEDEDGGEGEDA